MDGGVRLFDRSWSNVFVDEMQSTLRDESMHLGQVGASRDAEQYGETDDRHDAVMPRRIIDAVLSGMPTFTDATQNLRLAYVTRLASMRFEGYVAYAALEDPAAYEDTYVRLLGTMIERRLMAAES